MAVSRWRFGFAWTSKLGPDAITAQDGRAVVEMLAEVPDLWDVNVGSHDDMLGSRFRKEGWQEGGIAFVKRVTSKPVVGVGRFTSPDTMVSLVKRGVLDFIGAALPSQTRSCRRRSKKEDPRTYASVSAATSVLRRTL